MENSTLIVRLIYHELLHQRFLLRLQAMGLDTDNYCFDLMSIVARLMGLNPSAVTDEWAAVYTGYWSLLRTDSEDAALLHWAGEAYTTLLACRDMELAASAV